MKKSIVIFFLAMIPSIATIFLLIEFFPLTGLGRVLSIPVTLFINITILLISLRITQTGSIGRPLNELNWLSVDSGIPKLRVHKIELGELFGINLFLVVVPVTV